MTGSRILFRLLPLLALVGAAGLVVNLRLEHGRLLAEREALRVRPAPAPTSATVSPARATGQPLDADDAAAVARLRMEVDRLRQQIAERERALRDRLDAAPAAGSPPSILEESVAYTDWRNAGQADPTAAVETALWAAAGGEIDRLAQILTVGPAAEQVADLFARLPADLQAEYREPLRLLALMTSADVPLTAARLNTFDTGDGDRRVVIAVLSVPDNPPRIVKLDTLRDPHDGRWRIVVPAAALARYRDRLTGAAEPEPAATAPAAG